MMNKNPWNDNAYQLQIIAIILAPTCIAASVYMTLKHMIIHFGQQYSVLRARNYPLIFVGCDIASLVLQVCPHFRGIFNFSQAMPLFESLGPVGVHC